MAKTEKKEYVTIEVTRSPGYWRGGKLHKPGRRLQVPAHAVKSITEATPPFGKIVEEPAEG